MIRRKLKDNKRPKALFGEAVVAGAILASSAMQVGAQAAAANTQAKAIKDNATANAQAMDKQNQMANQQQKEQLDFVRQQNTENRDQQQEIQTTMQLLAGQENMNDRLEATKVQVKCGGSARRKLRSAGGNTPLRGSFNPNMPFMVTDGGGVVPVGTTPEGYDLYEIYGNDHEHYHKTRGKAKTGVGLKFANGANIEGEGNQGGANGELMLVTPNDALFISKHSLKGFNPAEAVRQGMHPIQAFATQEEIKDRYNIPDDGNYKSKRKKLAANGAIASNYFGNITQLPSNGTAPVAGALAYMVNNPETTNRSLAKCGKRVKRGTGGWSSYAGATYQGIGNVVGAGLNILGGYISSGILGDAYREAGNTMADAYSRLKGIDLSTVSRDSFAAPHTMAVIRSANVNANPQLEAQRKAARDLRRSTLRNTLSSAAQQQRLAAIDNNLYDQIGQIEANRIAAEEQIKQGNAERITATSEANANRDAQANQEYTQQMLNLMQYNNSIENSKIMGMAQSRADALTNAAGARANFITNAADAAGKAIVGTANGFGTAITDVNKSRLKLENSLAKANPNEIQNYWGTQDIKQLSSWDINKLKSQISMWEKSSSKSLQRRAAQLKQLYPSLYPTTTV